MASSFIGSNLLNQKIALLEAGLATTATSANELKTWAVDRVKYVYPNGGTSGNESATAINSTYVMANPFANGEERLTVKAQANNGNGWFDCGAFVSFGSAGTIGLRATMNDGLIFLATGSHLLGLAGNWSPSPEVETTATKIRVMCIMEGMN